MAAASSLTSDEVNYLIFRYLQESGFKHSAFTFGCESLVHRSPFNPSDVPPGGLISFLQKGIQFMEIEARLDAEDSEVSYNRTFDLLNPVSRASLPRVKKDKQKASAKSETPRGSGGSDAMEDEPRSIEIPQSDALTLEGHTSEVFNCSWCPTAPLLASGSGDSTARIWTIPSNPSEPARSVVLRHKSNDPSIANSSAKVDVTTLDWSSDGSMLATGAFDGVARCWTANGDLKLTMSRHKGAIFSLKWNKTGNLLLSGSVDKTAVVWDAKTGEVRQQFDFHKDAVLDVDWRNETTFATGSKDSTIFVCKYGEAEPIRTFRGHEADVNAIKWDPSGRLLASCSDDSTAKIWSMKGGGEKYAHDLREHTKAIYSIKWSPTGQGSANPNKPLVLASASFDSTVKIWDPEAGKSTLTLSRHTVPVYSVAFSPNGEYLASGSFDKTVVIWSLKDGSAVRKFSGSGGIFEVAWNSSGDKVAAAFSSNNLSVIDMRM